MQKHVPSAGAFHPHEVYVAAGEITGLEPGMYHYVADGHHLERTEGDAHKPLSRAADAMRSTALPPCVLLLAATPGRTETKYGIAAHYLLAADAGVLLAHFGLLATSVKAGGCCLGPMVFTGLVLPGKPMGAFSIWG